MTASYSITAKGKAELAAKPGQLAVGLKTLLGMVSGDTTSRAFLHLKLPQVPEDKLTGALDRLVAEGYIQVKAAAANPKVEASLDFTRFISRPVKEPTVQQKRQAEATLAGVKPSSKQAGFHVSIINRSAKRIAPHAGGDKHTVLVIDADEANALVMARALLMAKFDTRSAGKRDEIVAALNQQPAADAIAMDTNLPDVGGLELLGRLREHPTYKSVPIIVMAGKVEHDDVVAALAYGASGYMTRPFKPEALLENVKAVLGL
jgi:two-component system chemotaxis response regulator CheY